MLRWFRRCLEAERLARADAEALIRDHGGEAYSEARRRERDVIMHDGTTSSGRTATHWRLVALIVTRMTASESASTPQRECSNSATGHPNAEGAISHAIYRG